MEQWEVDLARIIWERHKLPTTCAVEVVEEVKRLRAKWLHEWRETQMGRQLRQVK
jgi:hypothetical protein